MKQRGVKGEWPAPAHDDRLSGRAEVPCGMPSAPGEVWSLDIGMTPPAWATAADVDGDGRPEFIAGGEALAAFKALNERAGTVLWEVPVPGGSRSPIVADVDGDGLGEIVAGCGDGRVRVYK